MVTVIIKANGYVVAKETVNIGTLRELENAGFTVVRVK